MYDPTVARWMSPDPLAEKYYPMTPYGYCAGNPINVVDPNGSIIRDSKGNIVYATLGNIVFVEHSSKLNAFFEVGYVFANDGTPIQVYNKIIGDAGFDTNCHGTSFVEGKFWLNNDQVPSLLNGDNYDSVDISHANINDIIVYHGNTDSEHSMKITKTDGTMKGTEVYGQGGLEIENHTDNATEAWIKPDNSTIERKSTPDRIATKKEIKQLKRNAFRE